MYKRQSLYSPSRLENLAFAFFDFMGLSYILQTPSYNSAWWYMSFAITLVLLLPWLIKLCRRLGAYVLLPGLLLVRWLDVEDVYKRQAFGLSLSGPYGGEGGHTPWRAAAAT